MLRKICEVVADVARNLIDDNGSNPWPEFLQFPFQSGSAPIVQLQESALRIFSSVPGIFSNQQDQHLQPINIDEVIVSLSENASDMVRKRVEKYLTSLVPLVLQMITDLEDDEKWSVSNDTVDDNTSDNNMIAESALLVMKGTKLVLEQVVPTIALVADTAEKDYVVYYDRMIIQIGNSEDLRRLRDKTIECV
ncbi:hypothetical protein pipiens_010213 [Culex pipiens pipiens]|uniref:IPO4/5-like TPR repeats domain-containing protein n=1 Tax=Culex pipiens pipiens TaxID=38569 RepID=A0ABD1DB11_CULPP